MNEFSRQEALLPMEKVKNLEVTIVGAGAIGSWTAWTLWKMGVRRQTVLDDDTVELHNISNQIYGERFMGWRKVDALKEVLLDHGGYRPEGDYPKTIPKRLDNTSTLKTLNEAIAHDCILVLAADSLESRRQAVRTVDRMAMNQPAWIVDGRISGELGQVAVFPWSQSAQYLDSIDAEPNRDACGARSTAYCSASVAGFMAAAVSRIVRDRYITAEVIDFDFRSGRVLTERVS